MAWASVNDCKPSGMLLRVLCVLCLLCSVRGQAYEHFHPQREHYSKCYHERTLRPQRCVPEFGNAAFHLPVEATNTCGQTSRITYCTQTHAGSSGKSCDQCDYNTFPASHLTDFNNNENKTWWQSETMMQNIQHPNQVNLTLHLGKAFDITFISLKFKSPRPESFAIYKRTNEDGPWIPYQYYSDTCRDTYGLPNSQAVPLGDETRALCNDEYSHITPLTGGTVAFSTLEGRPSAQHFENSSQLQEWVTATDIRITLDRLNTFGDEVFQDANVLSSYYYAIFDFSVGGKCKCNGHASRCHNRFGSQMECDCQHNTAGRDCERCADFYNDVPWHRATSTDAHECQPCNCNGRSNRCYFDRDLYEKSGHGGHCVDCTGNTDGPNCERCQDNYYLYYQQGTPGKGRCEPCLCNEKGSRSLQCDTRGKCSCHPGVGGDKCDRCLPDHYGFGYGGCQACGCNVAGSIDSKSTCNPSTGECFCKENVEGNRCHKCKPGFFSLDKLNEFGCTPCFCYGHSSECRVTHGYSETKIYSTFLGGGDRWDAVDSVGRYATLQYDSLERSIGVRAGQREILYFSAPNKFLGDQRASYRQLFEFSLEIGDSPPRPSVDDVILEGGGMRVSIPIFQQGNPTPSSRIHDYRFVLHERPEFGWTPRLDSKGFMRILSNLTAIKIRGNYAKEDVGFLKSVSLTTAKRGVADGRPARWVETCTCPQGYLGQFCESCNPGFRHEPPNSGPFARCVPCNCHGHADLCDAASGRCICRHNTAGDNCELCARGFYGNALQGTSNDCEQCPCPNGGACLQLADGTVACLECPSGYAGARCELCTDGFFGDPAGNYGPKKDCEKCNCHGNIDSNAVGNCNRTSGQCLKCIYHTAGKNCELCAEGYFGDALSEEKGDCKPCECNSKGSLGRLQCDQLTGQCGCKDYVTGRQCDQCVDGFFNIESGQGCQPCNCDATGSLNQTCNPLNGQCFCRDGVSGVRCNKCDDRFFGFSLEGCQPCDCDPIGSLDLQCDRNGQCKCRENVEGRKCDRCKENRYRRQDGCIECPACYNLVQDSVNGHRGQLDLLDSLIKNITSTPAIVDDQDFETKLNEVQDRVDRLWTDARLAVNEGDGEESLVEQLGDLRDRLEVISELIMMASKTVNGARKRSSDGEELITDTQNTIDEAQAQIKQARQRLETEGKDALDRAVLKSQEFGQQSQMMSEIAREARELADKFEMEAGEIEGKAEEALNKSTEAYNLANNAVDEHEKGKAQVRKLQDSINKAEEWLGKSRQVAGQAKHEASKAFNDSLETLTRASSLKIPEEGMAGPLQKKAEEIEAEAKRIKDLAEKLMFDNALLIGKIGGQVENASQLLEMVNFQQQGLDQMLTQLDLAYDNATTAVEMGNGTLEEAKKTLETLQGFNELVQSTKDEAVEALKTREEILRLIHSAEGKTRDAQIALDSADDDAARASQLAEEAQRVAEEASQESGIIKHAADDTKSQANRVNDDADGLNARAAEISNGINKLEQRAENEGSLAGQALKKANEAKSNAQIAQQKVEKALEDVQDITINLENAQDINARQLQELERRLEEAEQVLEQSGLDKQIQELMNARQLQNQWMENYEKELAILQMEVKNIEDIKDSLPDGCFKRLKLEP